MSAQSVSKKKSVNVEEQVKKSLSHIINDFILANLKLIGMIIVAIIVIVAGVFGWSAYAKGQNAKALALEAEAFEMLEKINATTPDEKATQSWEDVAALYQKILNDFSGSESAERALVLSGNLYYTHGQYADAQKQFSAYLAKYPKGLLRNQAEESLAYVYEQQGDYQQALVMLKQVEAHAPDSQKPAILLALGRNYESLGQTDQAVEAYQGVVALKADSDTASSWKDMANERIQILKPGAATTPELVNDASAQEDTAAEQSTATTEQPTATTEKPSE